MGLGISTGFLADLRAHDAEGAAYFTTRLEALNRLLAEHDLPRHEEPETLASHPTRAACMSFPYSYLHRLRRALAYARQAPESFAPAPSDWDPDTDPLLDRELFVAMDSHLICHSDCEGFYLPIDFAEPLYDTEDEVPGGIVGSSPRLLQELILVAPLLGIALESGRLSDAEARTIAQENSDRHPLGIERLVWLALYEAASASIARQSALVFH